VASYSIPMVKNKRCFHSYVAISRLQSLNILQYSQAQVHRQNAIRVGDGLFVQNIDFTTVNFLNLCKEILSQYMISLAYETLYHLFRSIPIFKFCLKGQQLNMPAVAGDALGR
jgi:hypothetical protein